MLEFLRRIFTEQPESVALDCGFELAADADSLVPALAAPTEELGDCPVCMSTVPTTELIGLSCRHGVCSDCWLGYLSNAVMSVRA